MAEIATQANAAEWYKIVTDWPNFWSNYQKNFQGLLAQSDWIVTKHPELRAEYDEQVRKGSEMFQRLLGINASVESIKSGWDTFKNWLGLAGIDGLGFLPAIPVAIGVSAAVSAIAGATYLLKYWSELGARYLAIQDGEAKGLSPAEASKRADTIVGPAGSSTTIFGFPLKWIVIGGIALFALPIILPLLKRNR
jgi:hypothetical protein